MFITNYSSANKQIQRIIVPVWQHVWPSRKSKVKIMAKYHWKTLAIRIKHDRYECSTMLVKFDKLQHLPLENPLKLKLFIKSPNKKPHDIPSSEMISISTSQTFRSWVVIFRHRRPMACLSLNLYDTPELAPRMNVLFWGPGDFPVSYSNRDTLWNAWNRHSGSFMVDTGILLSNME